MIWLLTRDGLRWFQMDSNWPRVVSTGLEMFEKKRQCRGWAGVVSTGFGWPGKVSNGSKGSDRSDNARGGMGWFPIVSGGMGWF